MTNKKNLFITWIKWHFAEVPSFLITVWKNYILFAMNYFSLPVLVKTLFSPWRRYRWKYPKMFNVVEFMNTLISNFFSRIIGAIMRIMLIILGTLFQIFIFIFGAFLFLIWMILPLLVFAGILFFFLY